MRATAVGRHVWTACAILLANGVASGIASGVAAQENAREIPVAPVEAAASVAAPAADAEAGGKSRKAGSRGKATSNEMVRYDKPVMRNGRMVLYRGAWRGKDAQPESGAAAETQDGAVQRGAAQRGVVKAAAGAVAAAASAKAAKAEPVRLAIALDERLAADLIRGVAAKGVKLELAKGGPADLFVVAARETAAADSDLVAVARLYDCEFAVVGRPPAATIADLAGKRVAVPPAGSHAGDSARALLRAAVPMAQIVDSGPRGPAQTMAAGEADAFVVLGAKPRLDGAPADARLLSVPFEGAVRGEFLPAELTKADYPRLSGDRAAVDTVASPALLAARVPADPERRAALERFVDAFFTALRQGGLKEAKWKDVNPAARTPLARLDAAQAWIDKRRAN